MCGVQENSSWKGEGLGDAGGSGTSRPFGRLTCHVVYHAPKSFDTTAWFGNSIDRCMLERPVAEETHPKLAWRSAICIKDIHCFFSKVSITSMCRVTCTTNEAICIQNIHCCLKVRYVIRRYM